MNNLIRFALEWADKHALQAREAFTMEDFARAEVFWQLSNGYRDVAIRHGWDEDKEVVL